MYMFIFNAIVFLINIVIMVDNLIMNNFCDYLIFAVFLAGMLWALSTVGWL